MKTINNLVYAKNLRNEEANVFINSVINVYDSVISEDDRPVIEMLNISDDQLKSHLQELKNYYKEFHSTLDIPLKLKETDELYLTNRLRIRTLGDIKRIITMQNNNNPSEASEILKTRLDLIKNLHKKLLIEITGHIQNLLKDLAAEEMATYCESLKISSLITKLISEENKFEELYKARGITAETRVVNSYPSKIDCMKKYMEIIDYSNSMIKYNTSNNYDELINGINAIVNPMNETMRSRYKFKKKEDDRPVIE